MVGKILGGIAAKRTPFNPLDRSRIIEGTICKGNKRKYYQGGVRYREKTKDVAADMFGCNLTCTFCWADEERAGPPDFYSPIEIAGKMFALASQKFGSNDWAYLMLTRGEPCIGRDHLVGIMDEVKRFDVSRYGSFYFELQTNGILLGADQGEYARELASRGPDSLHVRISLKGGTPEGFEKRTGAAGKFLEYQYRAINHLKGAKIKTTIAAMIDPLLMTREERDELLRRLKDSGCISDKHHYNVLRGWSEEEWLQRLLTGSNGIFSSPYSGDTDWPQRGRWAYVEFESIYPYSGVARRLKAAGCEDIIDGIKRRYPSKVQDIKEELGE